MTTEELMTRLAAPFDAAEVKVKPGAVSGNRALALHFVDARVVQDRLDDVLGVTGWQDEYTVVEGNSVVCRLSCKIGEEWLTKMDVGSPSEQPDEGDRMKAAFSDALKRAAVKFGIGRYLYRLPPSWHDFDPQKRRFVKAPEVPNMPSRQPPHVDGEAQKANLKAASLALLAQAAAKGTTALQKQWESLSNQVRALVKADIDTIKAQAATVDASKPAKPAKEAQNA